MSDSTPPKTYALFANNAIQKIIARLENQSVNIILFPNIEISEILLDEKAEGILKNLNRFDWIIFPDIFAVDFFLRALENLRIDFFELDAVRVCAFGETVADRLRFSLVHADVILNDLAAQNIFRVLKDYDPGFESARFLIPKAENAKIEIADLLTENDAQVSEFSVYRASISQPELLPKLKALLKGGAIDEFIFRLPEDVLSLANLFPTENLPELLGGIRAMALDSAVFQSLRDFGVSPVIMRR